MNWKATLFINCIVVFCLCIAACKEGKDGANAPGYHTDSLAITGNKIFDKQLMEFSKEISEADSIRVFAIYLARNPINVRITAYPVRTLQDTLQFPYPAEIKELNNVVFILYNGVEILRPVNESLKQQFDQIRRKNSGPVSGLFDAPVLQYDIFSRDSVMRIVPPENPTEMPAKKSNEFTPPAK
jgi:hypothetical protein